MATVELDRTSSPRQVLASADRSWTPASCVARAVSSTANSMAWRHAGFADEEMVLLAGRMHYAENNERSVSRTGRFANGRRTMGQSQTVYVRLFDEGVVVAWRPVDAEHLWDNIFRLGGPIPDDETWEYQPNDIVACKEEWMSGERFLCAVSRLAPFWGGEPPRTSG